MFAAGNLVAEWRRRGALPLACQGDTPMNRIRTDWSGLIALALAFGFVGVFLLLQLPAGGQVAPAPASGPASGPATRPDADALLTRVYDIRDLLQGSVDDDDGEEPVVSQGELCEEIQRLIRECVAPWSWKQGGTGEASMAMLSGQLIVSQTPENHKRIKRLMGKLHMQVLKKVVVSVVAVTVDANGAAAIEQWATRNLPERADANDASAPRILTLGQAEAWLLAAKQKGRSCFWTLPTLGLFSGLGATTRKTRPHRVTLPRTDNNNKEEEFAFYEGVWADVRATHSQGKTCFLEIDAKNNYLLDRKKAAGLSCTRSRVEKVFSLPTGHFALIAMPRPKAFTALRVEMPKNVPGFGPRPPCPRLQFVPDETAIDEKDVKTVYLLFGVHVTFGKGILQR